MATQPEKQPGNTARKTTQRQSQKNNLATQPEKRPSPDLAGWQHTMGWRLPSPGIGDRMAPLHKLTSLRTRSQTQLHHLISQNSGLEAQKQARGHLSPKLATDGASPKFTTPTHTTRPIPNHHELDQPTQAGSTHHIVTRGHRGWGGICA